MNKAIQIRYNDLFEKSADMRKFWIFQRKRNRKGEWFFGSLLTAVLNMIFNIEKDI